ncbi:putative phosphohydrolase [Rhizobium leguminosarum bv. trifolii WSM597]|uniref:Putative phosphohydrolase n=1 Tax=Rhizobium leguminosarum bv. trifolii WSM597 TaxID=754764 RepID=J0HCU8_RHILT|nr:metallophosphoesterase [Rhizobium leguminosarum]EJB02276.1 putative phosphohydrolase [Rhizobium leguminosarum bv. trifolii WSM597]EJB08263.1 putative phosphohydrolase [Rhizobium leguminosarum bv. trifolii WSM597]
MLFLHLSDIHFKKRDIGRSNDPNMGLRDDLIDDIQKMRAKTGGPVDAILISGDIAFAGDEEEYAFALKWIREKLCPASGCRFEDVMVIPGNHDVDRRAANNPMERRARASLRETPVNQSNAAITDFLNHKDSAEMLFKPIDNYNRFAANFECVIGFEDETIPRKPYVTRQFPLNDGSAAKVWGFNSVLVCDADDKKETMFVDPSAAQIERESGVVHMVMCHHPFSWLRNEAEFRERIDRVAKVHLFGHEHTVRISRDVSYTRIRAGAVQPERDEPGWKPGYNFIEISVDGQNGNRKLAVKVWVRQREGARYIEIPDPEDDSPFWSMSHKLPLWTAPPAPVIPALLSPGIQVIAPAEDNVMAKELPTTRSVAPKLLALSEADQLKIINSLGLAEEGDADLRDYEAALAAIRRAADRGRLIDLDSAIDEFNASRGA